MWIYQYILCSTKKCFFPMFNDSLIYNTSIYGNYLEYVNIIGLILVCWFQRMFHIIFYKQNVLFRLSHNWWCHNSPYQKHTFHVLSTVTSILINSISLSFINFIIIKKIVKIQYNIVVYVFSINQQINEKQIIKLIR